jgi:hypothetical protein
MIIGYLPFYYGLVPLLIVLAFVWRERKRKHGFTPRQKRAAIIASTVIPATVLGGAYLLNLSYAQDIKTQQLALNRASSVTRSIQAMQQINFQNSRSEKTAGRWADPDVAEVARSGEIDVLIQKADALSHGKPISFSSEHGKDVTIRLVPSESNPALFDTKIFLDGKSVNDAMLNDMQSSTSGNWDNGSGWVNDYPTFVDSRFSKVENP